jgi:endo-1,4-beta-mannosidase
MQISNTPEPDSKSSRRAFLRKSAATVAAAYGLAGKGDLLAATADHSPKKEKSYSASLLRHRFGVNYVPSKSWFYFWNDFDADSVARDLDAIASLGVDHIRMLLVWAYFQPNRTWVSPTHLDRLEKLMTMAGQRGLDVQVLMLNGWLAFRLLAPFDDPNKPADFYRAPRMIEAQELFFRETAMRVKKHKNFIGFDVGNEMECCWSTGKDTATGDAWCERFLTLAESLCPDQVHVNGTWGQWFLHDTFSPGFMAKRQRIPIMHCYPTFCGADKYGGFFDPPSIQLPAATAALIRAYANDPAKPVWAQEYGMCKSWLPEARIPQFLEETTLAGIQGGVSWFTCWASHDVDHKFEQADPILYDFGLISLDNKIKPQGHKFKELAQHYRGKPVSMAATTSRPLPPPPSNHDETWKWLLNWMNYRT